MAKFFKVTGIGISILFVGLIMVGNRGPEISVYIGNQVPSRFVETLHSLKLLEKDETIQYFYSDAFLDIKTGLYFVTDRNLVLYSNDWEVPVNIIALDSIISVEPHYDNSFLQDTQVYVTTASKEVYGFPVSSEKGLDKKFVESLSIH